MNKILDVVEDIKQKITDNQYKIIMDSLMEVNKISKFKILNENHERNNFFCLFIWLDTKLEITENKKDCIMRGELETYIINKYLDYMYYENIKFVNQILKIYFMFSKTKQNCCYKYNYVKFRD